MLNSNASFDGKTRASTKHVAGKCEPRCQQQERLSSDIGTECIYHNSFLVSQPQIARQFLPNLCLLRVYVLAFVFACVDKQ